MIKKILITVAVIITSVVATGYWFFGLLPKVPDQAALEASQAEDIAYIQRALPATRGKILTVVTSTDTMGESGKATGYELTELSRAYWVFKVNGFEVDIASIEGGKPPVIIDDDDMKAFDYAFLNDKTAQQKVNNSLAIADVKADDYQAVYFVGGKGAMFDFPDNINVQNIVRDLYQQGKVVAAICHGPAAFTNVVLDDGSYLVANKRVTSFTNDEELLLIPDAQEIFGFLLEDKLAERGAIFDGGFTYLNQVHQDDKVITGQNPWSIWQTAEAIISNIGYQPLPREKSPEEYGIELLETYAKSGYDAAYQQVQQAPKGHYGRMIVALHSVVAIMRLDIIDTVQLMRLTNALKARDE